MMHGPEADEIAQLASKLGFSLTLDEAEIYIRVIGMLEGSMADLADREEDRPPTRYRPCETPVSGPIPRRIPTTASFVGALSKGVQEALKMHHKAVRSR